MTRVAIYARYSSDNQRDASIDDQIRLCREQAEYEGWNVAKCYSDRAISGASLIRPGIQALIEDTLAGKHDVILAEALDRLSRDQEDIAGLYKRACFAGVKIVTLSEGEISDLHIGLKGTMNALFLKDLADKTRRGLRGRIEAGKSGGGKSYGYDVVKKLDAEGDLIRGERKINRQEAAIVYRIHTEYAAGASPLAIAAALNREGIASPSGRGWGQSTINGNARRGTGILNNELYVGRLVWNRLHYLKDPDSGKRVSRLNPEDQWVFHAVPALRIIESALWDRVKTRQKTIKRSRKNNGANHFRDRRRPRYLLSGLLRCGVCGGVYTAMSKGYFGCSARRNKGICENGLYIRHDRLEGIILDGLKHHLIEPESFASFCKAFTVEVNRLRMEASSTDVSQKAELGRIERSINKLLEAIKAGGPAQAIVKDMQRLETRQRELEGLLSDAALPPPLLHPNMAKLYSEKLMGLYEALQDDTARQEAITVLRSLIDQIDLVPENGVLQARITGDLAGLLTFMNAKPPTGDEPDGGVWFELVAGVGFEPTTFRL